LPLASPVCDWECKGNQNFGIFKLKAKILFLSLLIYKSRMLPVEAGCKGKVNFSGFARALRNFFL
jgi:hypothetical protein